MIVEMLRNARALYAANPSHAAGSCSVESGTHCPITAITEATFSSHSSWHVIEAFRSAAGDPHSIAAWNAQHTTEEVLAAFDRAIEAAS